MNLSGKLNMAPQNWNNFTHNTTIYGNFNVFHFKHMNTLNVNFKQISHFTDLNINI